MISSTKGPMVATLKLAGLDKVLAGEPTAWVNPGITTFEQARPMLLDRWGLGAVRIDDAERRLERFAPLVAALFPTTRARLGIIESDLVFAPKMQAWLEGVHGRLPGSLLLKCDSHLDVAGSVKARGGVYEVLTVAEGIALEHGLLTADDLRLHEVPLERRIEDTCDPYTRLASDAARSVFSGYRLQVGSTGNLGLSVGIMGSALGFSTTVHMSRDAKQWKKDLLRARGAKVVEYEGDYASAVERGRELSKADETSHFVDDENSRALFLGYAVAGRRFKRQLCATAEQDGLGIRVDADHPLFVYIPCGVGGAPGGITFGLKHEFGDDVHVFFVEPTQSPCMLVGMATDMHGEVSVQNVGLSGRTEADGLAVARPSSFVGRVMKPLLSGEFTVDDDVLFDYMSALYREEGRFVEPSGCAAFAGPARLLTEPTVRGYLEHAGLLTDNGPTEALLSSTHVVWATGGSLMPREERARLLRRE